MKIDFDENDLRPLVEAVQALQADDAKLAGDGRIGLTEAEAAARLGVARHTLRDARLRGEVSAKRIGKGYVYSVQSLTAWLAAKS